MEDGILLYTRVDNGKGGFEDSLVIDANESVRLAVEKLCEAVKTLDEVYVKDMQNSLLDFKLTYDEYRRYMYSTASNNQLKRHRLPMRRKVRRDDNVAAMLDAYIAYKARH